VIALVLMACGGRPPELVAPLDLTFSGASGEVIELRFDAEDPDGDAVLFWWPEAPPGWAQASPGGPDVTWTVDAAALPTFGELILESGDGDAALHAVYPATFLLNE
jgi:hypothetical protein